MIFFYGKNQYDFALQLSDKLGKNSRSPAIVAAVRLSLQSWDGKATAACIQTPKRYTVLLGFSCCCEVQNLLNSMQCSQVQTLSR